MATSPTRCASLVSTLDAWNPSMLRLLLLTLPLQGRYLTCQHSAPKIVSEERSRGVDTALLQTKSYGGDLADDSGIADS